MLWLDIERGEGVGHYVRCIPVLYLILLISVPFILHLQVRYRRMFVVPAALFLGESSGGKPPV